MNEIPHNERLIILELEEGGLDSLYWKELSPFYLQPLSVPFGELRYLYDLFPHLPDKLPLTSKKVEKYEPWNQDNIDIFFEDYPFLLPFKALLSFNTHKKNTFGYIKFSSKISNYLTSNNPTASILLNPFKQCNVEAQFTLDNNPIIWQRRRLTFTLPYLGKIQIGNFSLVLNKGLFYGYFPESKDTARNIRIQKKWFYGESRTWNGIAGKTAIGEKIILDIFSHIRETESVSGIKTTYKPSSIVSFYGAFSGSHIREYAKKDTMFSAHFGALFNTRIFSLNIESGIDLFMLNGIPFYCEIKYGESGGKYTLTLIRIPERFSAPRSRVLHGFYNILGTNDSIKGVITMTSISSISTISDYLKQTVSFSYIFMDHISSLRVSVKFAGMRPFIYSLTYSLSSANGVNGLKQKIKFSHTNRFTKYLGMTSQMSLNFDHMKYRRFLINIQGELTFFSTYSVSPFLTYSIKNAKNRDFSIGLKQHLDLFEKTNGEFTLLFPVISQSNKNTYSIYATLNFLL